MNDAIESTNAETAEPIAMLSGTFALYPDGTGTDRKQGGFVLVTKTEQYGERRDHIPGAMVHLAVGGQRLTGKIGDTFRGMFDRAHS